MNAPIIEVPQAVIVPESRVMWPGFLLYEPRPVWNEETGLYEEAPGVAWLDGFTVRWRELALEWRGDLELVRAPGVN